jgi:hypothetical protein
VYGNGCLPISFRKYFIIVVGTFHYVLAVLCLKIKCNFLFIEVSSPDSNLDDFHVGKSVGQGYSVHH